MKNMDGDEIDPVELTKKTWRTSNGRPIHDGDCNFWSLRICTCGLLHHLSPMCLDDEKFSEERTQHNGQVDRVPEPQRPPSGKKAKKIRREAGKMLRDVFDEADKMSDKMFGKVDEIMKDIFDE